MPQSQISTLSYATTSLRHKLHCPADTFNVQQSPKSFSKTYEQSHASSFSAQKSTSKLASYASSQSRFIQTPRPSFPILRNCAKILNGGQTLLLLGKTVPEFTPLLKATWDSFYYVSIHPFQDGNGRTSRILFATHVAKNGMLPVICSEWLSREQYLRYMSLARSGNPFPWCQDLVRSQIAALEGLNGISDGR
ncbi:hypothetical protein IG631_22120 [Alternaria alternata]|nr:hypothetical protein IG631_22120 [Alternaria alternata]